LRGGDETIDWRIHQQDCCSAKVTFAAFAIFWDVPMPQKLVESEGQAYFLRGFVQ